MRTKAECPLFVWKSDIHRNAALRKNSIFHFFSLVLPRASGGPGPQNRRFLNKALIAGDHSGAALAAWAKRLPTDGYVPVGLSLLRPIASSPHRSSTFVNVIIILFTIILFHSMPTNRIKKTYCCSLLPILLPPPVTSAGCINPFAQTVLELILTTVTIMTVVALLPSLALC